MYENGIHEISFKKPKAIFATLPSKLIPEVYEILKNQLYN